jgi:hypothetical protein
LLEALKQQQLLLLLLICMALLSLRFLLLIMTAHP